MYVLNLQLHSTKIWILLDLFIEKERFRMKQVFYTLLKFKLHMHRIYINRRKGHFLLFDVSSTHIFISTTKYECQVVQVFKFTTVYILRKSPNNLNNTHNTNATVTTVIIATPGSERLGTYFSFLVLRCSKSWSVGSAVKT